MHEVIGLLKKAHKNQLFAVIDYIDRIILKNKMGNDEWIDYLRKRGRIK